MELEKIVREERLEDSIRKLRGFNKEINKSFDKRLDEYYLGFINVNDYNIEEMNLLRKFCNYIKKDI